MKRILRYTNTIFILFLLISASVYAETARGIVFNDRNGNGIHDRGEPGLSGVRVSNGLDIVTTNATGRYEIAVERDNIVFVLKPRNWQTALDEQHIPRFYYIHKPEGSPDDNFKYPGVKPTGPLPTSIDFPLTSSPEPDTFSVVIMGDPQPYNKREVLLYANNTLAELVGFGNMLGISMGDIVGNDLSLFEDVNAVQGKVGIPWYNVLGNHDLNFYAPDDASSDETFERTYGPPNYAFQYGSVHFIVLDNVYWKGYTHSEKNKKPIRLNYMGKLRDDQLQFVANYLRGVPSEEMIVICTHIPLPEAGQWQRINSPTVTNKYETIKSEEELVKLKRIHSTPELKQLLDILFEHPHNLSFSGHTHTNQHIFVGSGEKSGAAKKIQHHHNNVATASGSWYSGPPDELGFPVSTMPDGVPNGYVIASFENNSYRLRYKASGMSSDYQMAVHAPMEISSKNSEEVEIIVNIFNSTERSKIEMRVHGQSDWLPMQLDARIDPIYAKLRLEEIARKPKGRHILPEPVISTHIWLANLPARLPVGVHVLEVRSTDMFGQVDSEIRLIEVVSEVN